MKQTLIGVQDEYISKINEGYQKWGHRPKASYESCGGHFSRIARGARRKAEKNLRHLGFMTQEELEAIIQDAADVAELERNAIDLDN